METVGDSFTGLTLSEFSDVLASAEPVPGGGSASAIAASFAGSLLAMVARLSLDRPKYEGYRATHERALAAGDRGRRVLLDLADDDARAYAGFAAARKMPRDTEDQQQAREEATQTAAKAASEVPLRVVDECARLLEHVLAMAGRSNVNAASDLAVAARLCAAAAKGAGANVLINLPMVGDEGFAGASTATLDGALNSIDRAVAQVSELIGSGELREPESEEQ
ncbi:MAG: cyclodeaminase/cyclohydrolase family protein [Chloroflexota bacterium]